MCDCLAGAGRDRPLARFADQRSADLRQAHPVDARLVRRIRELSEERADGRLQPGGPADGAADRAVRTAGIPLAGPSLEGDASTGLLPGRAGTLSGVLRALHRRGILTLGDRL